MVFFYHLTLAKGEQKNSGANTYYMCLATGDMQDVYYRQLWFDFVSASMGNPEGYYNVESNGVDLEGTYVYRTTDTDISVPIVSGTFKITPTNSYPPYRVDVDVITDDGERIKGSYINGEEYDEFEY